MSLVDSPQLFINRTLYLLSFTVEPLFVLNILFSGIKWEYGQIGKTDSLLNIPQIDDYAFSLDFHTPDIYLVDEVEKMYNALTHILDHDQLKEDWFEDTDGDLKNRVAKFMEAFGYKEVSDADGDGIPDHLDDEIG